MTLPSSAEAPAVHQFARIGAHAFLGGMSGLENDVIPYGMALGNRARFVGPQHRRPETAGIHARQIQSLRHAYRLLFADEGTLVERLADVEEDESQASDRERNRRLHQSAVGSGAVRAARGLSAVIGGSCALQHPQRTRMRGLQVS